VLAAELGLDGTGHLLDAGCGPGVLAVELAPRYERVTGLDPDAGMLAEARAHAARRGVTNVDWCQARAEDAPDLGPLRTVTFGQSFHWTDQHRVADLVHARLEPGGALVIVVHEPEVPTPDGPGEPPIPLEAIYALIRRYLGPERRAGQGTNAGPPPRLADVLERTVFGRPREVLVPGRRDVVRSVDDVVAMVLSMSYAAPHLFGDRLDAFLDDLRALLADASTTGRFWEWPGDTLLMIAER
jgi:SAM-dependent methyltransferase